LGQDILPLADHPLEEECFDVLIVMTLPRGPIRKRGNGILRIIALRRQYRNCFMVSQTHQNWP